MITLKSGPSNGNLGSSMKIALRQGLYFATVFVFLCTLSSCMSLPVPKIEFSVETIPPEASIYVDGTFYGFTPKVIEVSKVSSVTLELDGYETYRFSATQYSGDRGFVRATLNKLYQVHLAYSPEGSEIWENGKLLGKTPLTIYRPEGRISLRIKHEYFHDLLDTFDIVEVKLRARVLKAKTRYFPDTVCSITSSPQGAEVVHFGLDGGKIISDAKVIGTTPLNITNAELSKISKEHLVVIRKEGLLPSIMVFNGSIEAHFELGLKEKDPPPTMPKNGIIQVQYKMGRITQKDVTLDVISKNGEVRIINPEIGVDVEDMKAPLSKNSGAAFWGNLFFSVRYQEPDGETFYLLFDRKNRKRFRIEPSNFFYETPINGDIGYRQRVPITNAGFEKFSDLSIVDNGKNIYIFAKPYGGASPYLIFKSDQSLQNMIFIGFLGSPQ